MNIGIVGAGPGGLSAAMLLASHGFSVEVYEREEEIGSRSSCIEENGYRFDVGPTFFMMPFILEEIFGECDKNLHDYVDLIELDPYYQLVFADGQKLTPQNDFDAFRNSIEEMSPGDGEGFDSYMKDNKKKMDRVLPVLQRDYGSHLSLLSKEVLSLLPVLRPTTSLWEDLGRHFSDDRIKVAFTFQSKYLGMSPFNCPSMFTILPYIEYNWGIHHVKGGLCNLSRAMAQAFEEMGGEIHLDTEVTELLVENREAVGVELEDGEKKKHDEVIVNADFAWAMKNLLSDRERKKYTDKKLDEMGYSCSTYMIYLGLDKTYDHLEHHNIFITEDYKQNFREIESQKVLPQEPSFYVANPAKTDPSMAPDGHTALYVLVPIPNLKADIDWTEERDNYRELVFELLKNEAGLEDIEEHIEFEKIITPQEWQEDYNVEYGATFNLAHNLGQMLSLRPRNNFEEYKSMWLVGGGTNPGSGLPTIYESGRITADLITKKYGQR
ncbi:NAD(P)/FAD-dependent oxidoreductase [Methanonatronarchaeum sp. AMET6-2]|uniref:phytoene desaturase family protein n=1 Tax=Methanonatronarchaeum sp. AMET6-2 TaxID=2933293 RepID=UPI0011F8FE90|nr:phytoene desaturase family protein [Methanonatronarchaeum sp. AMET6-2]RZN61776.1 MAG: phytoene desaturase [Methanonatronarchaeia archaeon]UOY09369.1 phytoene desaturase family protein [Methanonatronarchaeum sp. AMET6-2]